MWTDVDGYLSEAGQTWTCVRKNVDVCGRLTQRSPEAARHGGEPRSGGAGAPRPEASRFPGAPSGGGGDGRGAGENPAATTEPKNNAHASGARRYLGAPVRTLGAPLSPHLHRRQAVFLDWGICRPKPPSRQKRRRRREAAQSRSRPVSRKGRACLDLDGAATLRQRGCPKTTMRSGGRRGTPPSRQGRRSAEKGRGGFAPATSRAPWRVWAQLLSKPTRLREGGWISPPGP